MKKIAFIGGFDKLDLIQYVAIVLSNVGKKVLIVDTTKMQKSRYITPAIDNTKEQYITTTQGVDLAVGYKDYGMLSNELSLTDETYDYMFLDIDNYDVMATFSLTKEDVIFLTTTFDIYSLKVAYDIIARFENQEIVNKILFAKTITPYHVQYIQHICKSCNLTWGNISIFFPYDNGDLTILFENQREYKMTLSKFSKDFLGSLLDLCVTIEPEQAKSIRKFIKDQARN